MARGGGAFNFAKRQKELKKQQKKRDKLERRRQSKAEGEPSVETAEGDGDGGEPLGSPPPTDGADASLSGDTEPMPDAKAVTEPESTGPAVG
jgi:hypothetical protein